MGESRRTKREDNWLAFPVKQKESATGAFRAFTRPRVDTDPFHRRLDELVRNKVLYESILSKEFGGRIAENLPLRVRLRPPVNCLLDVDPLDVFYFARDGLGLGQINPQVSL